MSENKKTFREQQIQILTDFSKTPTAQKEADSLYQQLFESNKFKRAQTIGVTISMGFELETKPIIEHCLQLGKGIYIPKTNDLDKSMSLVKFTEYKALTATKFGVLEPSTDADSLNPPDLVIVPGLAFLDNNYRLGFGAGFYDRYLAKYQPSTISLANSKQIYHDVPWKIEPHDKPIDKIITAK